MAECPTCGRWLVTIYKDGTFSLAGNAAVSPAAAREGKPLATCYRWRCRLRRYRARQGGLFRLGVSRHG